MLQQFEGEVMHGRINTHMAIDCREQSCTVRFGSKNSASQTLETRLAFLQFLLKDLYAVLDTCPSRFGIREPDFRPNEELVGGGLVAEAWCSFLLNGKAAIFAMNIIWHVR